MKLPSGEPQFWVDAFRLQGSATPLILPRAVLIGLFALVVTAIDRNADFPSVGMEITPFEVAGGALGVFLVLRTNAGYDRWWEGRRLWGDIVNRCRNLALGALAMARTTRNGADRMCAERPRSRTGSRLSLRGDPDRVPLDTLLGPEDGNASAPRHTCPRPWPG